MTCPCRMQYHLCKELGENVIYLCPMHITQRCIVGYDVLETHERLRNLNREERVAAQKLLCNEMKF